MSTVSDFPSDECILHSQVDVPRKPASLDRKLFLQEPCIDTCLRGNVEIYPQFLTKEINFLKLPEQKSSAKDLRGCSISLRDGETGRGLNAVAHTGDVVDEGDEQPKEVFGAVCPGYNTPPAIEEG